MKIPRSPQDLFAKADVVVVGSITGIKIQAEPSRMNLGFGNYDWGIYCSLHVDSVDKGTGVNRHSDIIVRCQRANRTKSFDCFACGYHFPIPEVGQPVRAYLRQSGEQYLVLDPNGFTPLGPEPLVESASVRSLPPGRYTYLMPLEMWLTMAIPTVFIWGTIAYVRRRIACKDNSSESARPRRPKFSLTWLFAVVAFVAFGTAGQRWDSSFVGWMSLISVLLLFIFTLRPPKTAAGQSLWWGVNLTFVSAIIAVAATEML